MGRCPRAVILAGGQGERFWPLTHKQFPKYRIKFKGKRSLLQNTYERLLKVYRKENVYVVTTGAHAEFITNELPRISPKNIFIEPFCNNTCAAITLACAKLRKMAGDEETVSFFPADHLIQDGTRFKKTMERVIRLARHEEVLVTVGIQPTFPATGYGYIEKGRRIPKFPSAFRVKRFVEKPDRNRAARYVAGKKFYWNAGMFTWRLGVFLRAMKQHRSDIVKKLDLGRLQSSYKKLPNISIDRALMEKAGNIAVCPTTMDWCDLGSWDMLFEKSPKATQNVYAQGLHYHQETNDSLIMNQTKLPLIVLGVSGIVAVQTPRGTLICRKGRSEEAALLARQL